MSGILGPVTAGRVAFALGSVGVGALVGGAVADHRDTDVGQGMLYGGLAAAAGLSLLYGGAYAWNRFAGARAGAGAGASQLGTTLGRFMTPASTTATTATHAASTLATTTARSATGVAPIASSMAHLPAPATLFNAAARPLSTSVPTIARTPALPFAAASGGTFVDALRMFVR